MLFVADQVYVAVKVGDKLINLSGGRLRRLVITEVCNQFLPTLELDIVDQSGVLTDSPLIHDGVVISVAITRNLNEVDAFWRDYICVPRQVYSRSNGMYLDIVGLLNYPLYVYGGGYDAFDSSSSDVAKNIAQHSGLNLGKVSASNDRQVWIRYGQTRAKFLREVCQHAWANSQSAYVCSVNRDGELYFVDLTRLRNEPVKWTFQVVSTLHGLPKLDNVIYVPEDKYKGSCHSDLFNSSAGYGVATRYFKFTVGSEGFQSPIEYSPLPDYLNVNKEINSTRYEYGGLDMGNTHSKYQLAKVQNLRNRSLYSTSIMCSSPLPLAAKLLDRAQFIYFNRTTNKIGAVYDGPYFIGRLVHTVTRNSYVVNYELIREGINSTENIARLKR